MADQSDTAEYDENATCWHLMVKTEGGEVSLLQNLDAPTARQAYRRLQPDQHPVKYINQPESGCFSWPGEMRHVSKSDIRSVDIIGPEGARLDPWRGVKPRIIDLMPERKRREAYEAEAREKRQKADEMAAHLGVISDLRPQLQDCPFRCVCCGKMQPTGSLLYYLPDSVRKSDSIAAIKEQIEANKWSGHSSGWCADCAPKEPKRTKPTPAMVSSGKRGWWRW